MHLTPCLFANSTQCTLLLRRAANSKQIDERSPVSAIPTPTLKILQLFPFNVSEQLTRHGFLYLLPLQQGFNLLNSSYFTGKGALPNNVRKFTTFVCVCVCCSVNSNVRGADHVSLIIVVSKRKTVPGMDIVFFFFFWEGKNTQRKHGV